MRRLIEASLAGLEAIGGNDAATVAARWLWHDTLGCAWSGFRVPQVRAFAQLQAPLSPGRFVVPAMPATEGAEATATVQLGAQAAAPLAAMAACWDEACEGLALAHGRPGVPVVAALWALSAQRPLSWRRALQATVLGYQVGGTMGAWLRILPGMHVDGFWPGLGVAAAVGWALELPPDRILDAVESCACQLPGSLYLPIAQGSDARNGYLAHSAWLGMACALSAAAGIAGPRGAAQAAAQTLLRRAVDAPIPLHDTPLVTQAYWKPYACVRHVQYGARAAALLRAQLLSGEGDVRDGQLARGNAHAGDGQLDVDAIDALRLTVYPEAVTYCGNRAPSSSIAAQFSLSHGVAAMLVHGALGPAQFRDAVLADPRVRRLEAALEIVADPERYRDGTRGATLSLRHRGRWHEAGATAIEGDAGNPPLRAQRDEKFRQLCEDDPRALAAAARIVAADGDADTAWVTAACGQGSFAA